MPNMTPAEWDASAAKARAATGRRPWCTAGACVEVTPVGDGVALTSTLGDDKGRVLYNADEWRTFIDDVKAGAWDHTVTPAMANVS